ncbi:hypothetical protein JYU34_015947, partial [Plutella xylostella]
NTLKVLITVRTTYLERVYPRQRRSLTRERDKLHAQAPPPRLAVSSSTMTPLM